jgi:hypothetical protein
MQTQEFKSWIIFLLMFIQLVAYLALSLPLYHPYQRYQFIKKNSKDHTFVLNHKLYWINFNHIINWYNVSSIINKYINCPNHYKSLSLSNFGSFYSIKKIKISKCCKPKIITFKNNNKHTNIEIWSKKLLLYSPFWNSKKSQVGTNVTLHDIYC